jgi:hypothetical protein
LRKLHLVGLTTDRDGLIFTARKGSKSGGFIVPLDDDVLAAVVEARAGRGDGAAAVPDVDLGVVEPVPRRPRHQSALTPREMQARLRAGRSIDEVAAEAGVDHEWVARFAVPILAEQAQVVELARGLVYAKPRLGESSERLGPSVMQNLSDRGIFLPDDVADAGWSAFQLHDSVWMIRFRYRSRGRNQEAQWEVDVPAGRLLARNRHASDLGYVEGGRRRRLIAPDEEATEGEPTPPRRPARRPSKAKRAPAKAKRAPAKAKRAPAKADRAPAQPSSGAGPAQRAPSRGRPPVVPARTASKPAKAAARAPKPATGASRVAAKAANGPGPAKAAAAARVSKEPKPAKAAKPARPPAAPAVVSKAPAPTPAKPDKPATAAKAAKPAKPAKQAGTRRQPTTGPAPEPGPTARSGGVRSAVAQVSTARVSASLAAAERAPWAAAVRPRAGARLATANGDDGGRRPIPVPERASGADKGSAVPAFEPRPLPAASARPVASRVRKVTIPSRVSGSPGETPPVSLPAPRRPAPQQEPLPVERPKRRRLRPR